MRASSTLPTQVRVTLPEALRETIEPLRTKWNPERALGNPAHLTIIYHDEAPDADLLIARLRSASREFHAFPLRLGRAARFPDPTHGAFLAVSDPTGSVSMLRQLVLAAPFVARTRFGLHVTLLHPTQGDRLVDAWPEICRIPVLGQFTATELQLVGPKNETIASIRLAGASADRSGRFDTG